eukprot:8709248-Pyramimonas_sp.AAC.1
MQPARAFKTVEALRASDSVPELPRHPANGTADDMKEWRGGFKKHLEDHFLFYSWGQTSPDCLLN